MLFVPKGHVHVGNWFDLKGLKKNQSTNSLFVLNTTHSLTHGTL